MNFILLNKKKYTAPILKKLGGVTCLTKKKWGGTDGKNARKRDNWDPAPS